MSIDLIALIRDYRQLAHGQGEDDSFDTAVRAVCKAQGLCPRCKLARGRITIAWDGNRPILGECPTCKGSGQWTEAAATYTTGREQRK